MGVIFENVCPVYVYACTKQKHILFEVTLTFRVSTREQIRNATSSKIEGMEIKAQYNVVALHIPSVNQFLSFFFPAFRRHFWQYVFFS